jgi:crotonobetainyl-CoA:carnitine CoA-transferase CaiB-like acyl-CoA transferase
MQEQQTPTAPLAGMRVLDFSIMLAGPYCARLLADVGAEVIKIEPPEGDDMRLRTPLRDGHSAYFGQLNAGKRSLALDLKSADAIRLVHQLVKETDILVENFRPGVMDRLGLGYEALRALNPRLIYCSITGFGQTGPLAPKVAYDFLIQAMGGLMSITGEADGRPGGGPQKVGIPILDLTTGMYGAVAVLAALAGREVTGRGDHIDIAMLDVQTAFLANQAMNYLLTGRTPKRQGNRHPNIMPQDVFKCRDGDVVLAVGNDGQFAKMCEALGETELGSDPRYKRNADRVRNVDELMAKIADVFARWNSADLVQALEKAGLTCRRINSIPEVFEQPQIKHRGMRMDLPHPRAGTVPSVANPVNFAANPLHYDRAPPLLGEHSDEILTELGLSDADVKKLRDGGVV